MMNFGSHLVFVTILIAVTLLGMAGVINESFIQILQFFIFAVFGWVIMHELKKLNLAHNNKTNKDQ